MYKIRRPRLTKLAGTNIASDQKQWPTEVLKALVEQHPYVDTTHVRVNFTRIEPESNTSSGTIIIANKAAIPFSIRPDQVSSRLELDPLDIVYDGRKFSHLNDNSLRRILESQQVGRMVQPKDGVPGGNRYIGDLTGDVTPLEWSSYPGGFAGPRTATAGCGLLSYVVKNQDDVSKLFNTLNTYNGINSAVAALGLRDSLESLKDGMIEALETGSRMAHVMKRSDGGFAVSFDGGDTRAVTAKDLRAILGPDFHPIMRHVLQRGWAMVRDFPTVRSVDSESLAILPSPIEISGNYRVTGVDGERINAMVCSQMIDFDGSNITRQKAFCSRTGRYAEGKAIQGWRTSPGSVQASDQFIRGEYVARDLPVTKNDLDFPIGIIDVGSTGCFIDESWGAPKATPNVTIQKIISRPGEPDLLICKRDDGGTCGLILLPALVRPQRIPKHHISDDILPEFSYYIPAHMSFVQTNGRMVLADKGAVQEGREMALLRKNAGMYYLHGKDGDGNKIQWSNLKEASAREYLAWYGADDDVIQDVMQMKSGEERTLFGLMPPDPLLDKEASQKILGAEAYIALIKSAAEEAIQGANQEPVAASDPGTMDAILSLQFVSDETLGDLVESSSLFEECEDRLARLLLAARQGEGSIQESAVQKALKGIGGAINSLKALEVALQSRAT